MGTIHQLPEHLIARILLILSAKEAAQTSLVCKAWHRVWLTSPSLDFGRNVEVSDAFIKFVDNTLGRYEAGNIGIDHLHLGLTTSNTKSFEQIDKWVGVAVKLGLKSLRIFMFGGEDGWYTLPSVIFQEAQTLIKLRLYHVTMKLGERIHDDKVIMFTCLRKLHLISVIIEDDMFERILERCPLIEDLSVIHCLKLQRIKVTNLYNLKKLEVRVNAPRPIQPIEIYAPNLQHFTCSLPQDCFFNLHTSRSVKYLALFKTPHPSGTYFDDLMQNFPQLEVLILWRYSDLECINISSHSLKTFWLYALRNLKEVKIDAPNMDKFLFCNSGTVFPEVSFISVPRSKWFTSRILVSNPCLDAHLISQLKWFIAKLIRSRISLSFQFTGNQICSLDDDEVTNIPILPLVEVEAMDLAFDVPLTNAISFLDSFFRICRPKSMEMERCGICTSLIYNSLTGTGQEPGYYHQQLKEVRFEIYEKTNHRWMPSYWEEMAKAPQDWERVRFKLQWEQILEA